MTLGPATGENVGLDIVGGVSSIVINTPDTPDTKTFDIVNLEFEVNVLSR